MTGPFPLPPKIVILTGPALSRESGFAPFDPTRLPDGARLEDVLTAEGFARDPARVLEFYNAQRRQLLDAVWPNPAHQGLAALDLVRKGEVLIVTRNIDDLLERAGARTVIHTHGELLKARCTICTRVSDRYDDITPATECPVCGNSGHLRPHIVWVGEEPLRMATVYEALAHCRLFLAIGTSVTAEPVAGFLRAARRAGARTVEFNREPSPNATTTDERHYGPLTETVPDYVRALIAE